jgi:hypothetical protein
MAIYRQVQTGFWQDDFVLQLTPEEKYFYLYLLTNSKTKQCGIYQLPMQVIILETGYNQETVEKLLKRFVGYGKVIYNSRTREIGIVNWVKYNPMESPKTRVCVEKELKEVKDKSMIGTIYPDRYPLVGVSQEEKEEEKEKAEAEEEKELKIQNYKLKIEGGENQDKQLEIKNYKLKIGGEENQNTEKGKLTSTAAAAGDLIAEGNTIQEEKPSKDNVSDEITNKDLDGFREIIDDYGDYKCKSIQVQGELLLNWIWNKLHPTPEEIRLTAGYIKTFGFGEVETAFSEAVKYDKKRLAYVEVVLKKRKERKDLTDKKEKERQKRLEAERKIEEQKKSGMGLGLLKKVYG